MQMEQPEKSSVTMWLVVEVKTMKVMNGFTLIELLIVISIVSITMAIGLPSFQSLIDSTRLTTAANSMVGALQLARMEALKQHKTVVIRKKTTGWQNGWSVFVDNQVTNNTIDVNEPVLVITTADAISSTISIQSTYTNYVAYTANGRVNGLGGHFTFCSSTDFRKVVIAATGRIHIETPTTCS